VKKKNPTRAVAFVLVVVVLLPAILYSGFEITALSTQENLIADTYRRQLDVVLYSINQYAWDVANTWASTLALLHVEQPRGMDVPDTLLTSFLVKHPGIDALFEADSAGGGPRVTSMRPVDGGGQDEFAAALRADPDRIDRLLRFSRQGYRKIEGMTLGDSLSPHQSLLLLFVIRDRIDRPLLAGFRIEETQFVNNILLHLGGDSTAEFATEVIRTRSNERVAATDSLPSEEFKPRRQLWLFPHLAVGIRLKGATIEEIARSRTRRNLALILLLDAVLIAGAVVIYRSVRREIDLVRLKSDFVSNVSHELRTPLALIRMYAETLEMGRLTSERKRREYYRTIVGETERLTRLVNNLLSFSRMEAGRKPYTLATADVNEIVSTVLETFLPHLQEQGFSPVVILDPSHPPILADQEAVQEALLNLIDNAVKYSGTGKYLKIATGHGGGMVWISVEDHGIGIAREHHDRIFETFERISTGLVHTTRGSGLGLSITKHIMDAHGGTVRLESIPGKGSTFRLVFPALATNTPSTKKGKAGNV
jgi:two-component system phosphate regulon sensor histidine kinase PhoR